MSKEDNPIKLYSIWINKNKPSMKVVVLGYTQIPELKEYGIILGGDKVRTFTTETFLKNFIKDD